MMWDGWNTVGVPTDAQIQRARAKRAAKDGIVTGAAGRAINRQKQQQALRARLARVLETNCFALYRGAPDIVLSDEDVEGLRSEACRGLVGGELRTIHNLLVKGLYRGTQELGWRLNPPSMVSVMSMEPSATTSRTHELNKIYNHLQGRFYSELAVEKTQKAVCEDPVLSAGQLLFTLVMHSGCVSYTTIHALPVAIYNGIYASGNAIWIECTGPAPHDAIDDESGGDTVTPDAVSGGRTAGELIRRVFPTPISALLLLRYYRTHGRHWPKKSVGHLIGHYINHLDSAYRVGRSPHKRLMEISRAKSASSLWGAIRAFSENIGIAPPISSLNMVRIFTGQHWRPLDSGVSDNRDIRIPEHDAVKPKPICRDLQRSLAGLNRQLRAPDVSGKQEAIRVRVHLREFVDRYDDLHPLIELLAHWAIHLLAHGNRGGRSLMPSSTLSYVHTVSGALKSMAGTLANPGELTGEEWEALYEEAVENSSVLKTVVAARLGYFHSFLERAYDFPEVDIEGGGGGARVEATLITPIEYLKARELLSSRGNDDLTILCSAALILGYRCGLRRNEVLGLQLGDFIGFEKGLERVELLVQRNGLRGLKSASATRRLPLWLLLTPTELTLIRQLRERRDIQLAKNGKLAFFHLPGVTRRVSVEQMVMTPITRALRHVTGDPSARFHQLRHAFGSLTCLRMFETEPLEYVPAVWRNSKNVTLLLPSTETPLWQKAGLNDTLSAIYQLAMWMGHASPSVTLQTYVHLLDWVLFKRLSDVHNPVLTPVMQAGLTGMSAAAVEKHNQRNHLVKPSAKAVVDSMTTLWPRGRIGTVDARQRDFASLETIELYDGSATTMHWLLPYQVERFLSTNADPSEPGEEAVWKTAKALGLSVGAVSTIHRNARYFACLFYEGRREAKGERRSRLFTTHNDANRPLTEKHTEKGEPQLPNFLAPPRSSAVRRYAEDFFRSLLNWHDQEPDVAGAAMRGFLEHSQRTNARLRLRKDHHKRQFFALLVAIGMRSMIRINVKIADTIDTEDSQIKRYFKRQFNLPGTSILVSRMSGRQGRYDGRYGSWQMSVEPPEDIVAGKKSSRRADMFWAALRFAILSAAVHLLEPESDTHGD